MQVEIHIFFFRSLVRSLSISFCPVGGSFCVINYIYGYWLSLDFVNESTAKKKIYLILLLLIFNSNEICFSFDCLKYFFIVFCFRRFVLSFWISIEQNEGREKKKQT